MKRILMTTIFLIIFLFVIKVDATTCKSNIDLYSYNYCNSTINLHIIDNDNKDINNIKFELYDSNNNIIKKSSNLDKGFYSFNILNEVNNYNENNINVNYKLEQNYDYNYNLLPDKYKKIINSINNITDIKNINSKDITIKNDNSIYALFFNIPFYVKQTNNYKNYEKIKIVVPATVQVTYYFRDCDYKNTNKCFPDKNKTIDIVISKDGYYDYDENINYIDYLNREDKDSLNKKTCTEDNCYFEIKDKIKELNIVIKNTIKNMNTIVTRRGKINSFEIKVINDDEKESRGNIITTYLNKDITVLPNSISDLGVLDKENNTITWDIGIIDNKSSFELYYDAFVNKNANTNKIYDTHTVLKSNIIKNHITSNSTSILLIENVIFEVIRNIIVLLIAIYAFYKIIDIRNKNMKKDRS